MQITWLGQAGLLINTGNFKIMIDPYLTDSAAEINPKNHRRIPADKRFFNEKPDIILITHEHADHYDPETLRRLLDNNKSTTVLAPYNAWKKIRQQQSPHNYVMFNRGTLWTHKGIVFTAVKAEHSDLTAIGCIIDDGRQKLYITGDTLYNKDIFADLPNDIYSVFLPINGTGNNMNIEDAKKFALKTGAEFAVPLHWGMFDNINPGEFNIKNAVIPKIHEQILF